jgi:hypothetical protein
MSLDTKTLLTAMGALSIQCKRSDAPESARNIWREARDAIRLELLARARDEIVNDTPQKLCV